MSTVSLFKYNNYFNRKVKYESTLAAYIQADSFFITQTKCNFFKNDGVNSTIIFNNYGDQDYAVEYDEYNNILTRWFIIEAVNTSGNQYQLTLKRDVVTDYFDKIRNAVCYIHKAPIQYSDDVAIYNLEGLQVNQIKTNEDLLRDKTDSAWIIGFYAENTPDVEDIPVITKNSPYETYAQISDYPFYVYTSSDYKYVKNTRMSIYTNLDDPHSTTLRARFDVGGSYSRFTSLLSYAYHTSNEADLDRKSNIVNNRKDRLIQAYFENNVQYHLRNSILAEDGKIIKAGNTLYQVQVSRAVNDTDQITVSRSGATFAAITEILDGEFLASTVGTQDCINLTIESDVYNISLLVIQEDIATFDILSSSNKLTDAPYKMFAMPYHRASLKVGSDYIITCPPTVSMNIATAIASKMSSNLYDLQLLPYCPFQELLTPEGSLSIDGLVSGTDYTLVGDDNNDIISIIYYCTKSRFTFDIPFELNVPENILDSKVMNESQFYRIVSPNYSSSFEFNLIRTGSISKFNVDCTYKPYSSYIHLNPDWSRLYGTDYNDARGLIVQGDFSVPLINDQWRQYQINNKNYLNAFNREVESIEFSNKIARMNEVMGGIVGTVQGTIAGAQSGALVGGGIGAAIGGAIGLVASGAGAVVDINNNDKMRAEALNLSRDKFNMSLQNIKALPYTLSKVSSYDSNNKIFPFLETYDCTETEKEAIRMKLKFNGMTINRIGSLGQFIGAEEGFYCADLIRIDIEDDYHLVNEIANELAKGVYYGDSI